MIKQSTFYIIKLIKSNAHILQIKRLLEWLLIPVPATINTLRTLAPSNVRLCDQAGDHLTCDHQSSYNKSIVVTINIT